MDRFRVKALSKLLERDVLSEAQTLSVITNVRKRINVLWMGALKHDNVELMDELRPLKRRWMPNDR